MPDPTATEVERRALAIPAPIAMIGSLYIITGIYCFNHYQLTV
jgi:hypothetical protein